MSFPGKKLLCTDLDDTLLCGDKSISEGNLSAIRELCRQGHFFAFASGRPVQSCLPIAREYGFDRLEGFFIIAYNGALIYDCSSSSTVYTKPLERKYLRLVFDEALRFNIHCHTYDRTNVVCERHTAMLDEYNRVIKMPPVITDDVCSYLKVEPLKIICAELNDRPKLEAFRDHMAPLVEGHLDSVFSSNRLLEYNACGAGKGAAVLNLCDILGVKHSDSIACGDQENDISMIEDSGIGCSVKNGVEALKEKADYVTENDNNNDAIAEVINRFVL